MITHRLLTPWLTILIAAVTAAGLGCSRDSGRTEDVRSAAPAGAQPVTLDVSGRPVGDLYGSGSVRGVVVASGAGERSAWAPVAAELARLGYQVLVYTQPQGGGAATAQAAADTLRRRGAEKVVFLASGPAAAAALEAARTDAAGVAVLAPAGNDPIPAAGMPAIEALMMASLNDGPSAALARRIYDAAPEPRTLALYPSRDGVPAVFSGEATSEIKTALLDFIRRAFEPQSA